MLVENGVAGQVGPARSRRLSIAAARAHPVAATAVALVALAVASTALRAVLVGWVHGPFVFMDELGYERMGLSFAHTGHFSLFGKGGLAYSPLYPIVLSPVYALTSSTHTAYEWVKVENAALISLSAFPVYAIARSVLSRKRAVGVAALSLVAPLMLYSGFEMSENLAYPLCLAAIWTMLRAARRPSLRNDALMRAAIVLASAARLETAILAAVARGLSNEAIGKELWVAEQTVKFHLTNIYRKLGVSNRTEAARLAYQNGLVDSPIGEQ